MISMPVVPDDFNVFTSHLNLANTFVPPENRKLLDVGEISEIVFSRHFRKLIQKISQQKWPTAVLTTHDRLRLSAREVAARPGGY